MSPRILVIEDDEFQLRLLQGALSDEGYDVTLTADGPEGIELYRRNRPDLVVLDLALPRMNGLEVIRRLKDLDPAARILVVTGFPSQESTEIAARYAVEDIITKPYPITDLIEKVRTALPPER